MHGIKVETNIAIELEEWGHCGLQQSKTAKVFTEKYPWQQWWLAKYDDTVQENFSSYKPIYPPQNFTKIKAVILGASD